ncbi:MAG: tetratricopeptide repeat protein [Candidatus Omnitrophica bacterium]|nr:tetratricopeptide repeat protein [Candidatus Omnitrophota bacterium]
MVDDFDYLPQGQKQAIYQNLPDLFLKSEVHHYNPLNIALNISLFKTYKSASSLYAINLLLFYGNTLLLFILVTRLTQNLEIGALTAILFAVHPVNAEMLSHITLNTVMVCAAFLQTSMILFWRHITSPQKTVKSILLSLILFLFALLFLETALLFPIYLSLLCLVNKNDRWQNLRQTIPFWITAFLYFGLWCLMAGPAGQWNDKIQHLQFSFESYTATLSFLLQWYFQNLIIPNNFVLIKNSPALSHSILFWNSALLLGIFLTICLLWFWRKNIKKFALAWFISGFTFMLPASIVHAYSMGIVIEPHWFYFSSMGFFMLFALSLNDLKPRIQTILYRSLICVLVIFWGLTSFRHHVIARTEISYLEYWLKNSPNNRLPASKLGLLYGSNNGLTIPAELISDMDNQTDYFIKANHYSESIDLLEKLVKQNPMNPKHNIWDDRLSALYLKVGETVTAENRFKLRFTKKLPLKEYLMLAQLLEQLEIREKALTVLDQGLIYYPQQVDLVYLKAVILANQNRFSEAESLLKAQNHVEKDERYLKLLKDIETIKLKTQK